MDRNRLYKCYLQKSPVLTVASLFISADYYCWWGTCCQLEMNIIFKAVYTLTLLIRFNLVCLNFVLFPYTCSAGINSIVNLQIAGEHGDCGPHKLDSGAFLYNPQAFMEKGGMYT